MTRSGILSRFETTTPRRIGICLFLFALAVRLIYLWEIRDSLYFDTPVLDAEEYERLSAHFLAGDWLLSNSAAYVHGPLYPILFALIKLVAPGLVGIRIVQAGLGALSCVLIFHIGERLRSRRGDTGGELIFPRPVPLIAGALAATYWPFVFFTGELLATTLVILLTLLFALQLLRPGPWTPGAVVQAALTLALLASARSNTLLLLPLALWWIGSDDRHPGPRWRLPVVFLAATLLFLTPFALRNVAVQGMPVPFQGRWSLYQGTNPDADGTPYARQGLSWQRLEALPYANGDRTPAARGRYYLDASLSFIAAHPDTYAWLLYRKFRLFWNRFEIPVSTDLRYYESYSRVSQLLFSFGLVVPLALAAFVWLRRRDRDFLLLAGFVGLFLVSGMVFTVCARYRLPALPFLLLFCSHGVWLFCSMARQRQFARLGAFTLITALAGVYVHTGVDAAAVDHLRSDWLQSQVHMRRGDLDRAEQSLQRRLEAAPGDSDALNSLANIYAQRGQTEAAEQTLLKGVAAARDHALPWINLGRLYLDSGRLDDSRRAYEAALSHDPRPGNQHQALQSLGLLRMLQNDPKGAYAFYHRALLERQTAHAYFALSAACAQLGRPEEQMEALGETVARDSSFTSALRSLGTMLVQADREPERAEHLLLRAVRLEPDVANGFFSLGHLYRRQGKQERARLAFAEARRLAPGR